MDYLGLFCLGAFVGGISTAALKMIQNIGQWQKVLVSVLPAVLSGVVLVFVDKFRYSPALGCYPMGLLVALIWAYTDDAIKNCCSDELERKIIGWSHIIASGAISIVAGAIVVIPVFMQLRDEMSLKVGAVLQRYDVGQHRDAMATVYADAQRPKSGAQVADSGKQ
jgi:hypothetical protein